MLLNRALSRYLIDYLFLVYVFLIYFSHSGSLLDQCQSASERSIKNRFLLIQRKVGVISVVLKYLVSLTQTRLSRNSLHRQITGITNYNHLSSYLHFLQVFFHTFSHLLFPSHERDEEHGKNKRKPYPVNT